MNTPNSECNIGPSLSSSEHSLHSAHTQSDPIEVQDKSNVARHQQDNSIQTPEEYAGVTENRGPEEDTTQY